MPVHSAVVKNHHRRLLPAQTDIGSRACLCLGVITFLVLTALKTTTAADFTAPAEFRIEANRLQPNPGPFTATIGKIETGTMVTTEFEPMVFRTKFEIKGTTQDELIIGHNAANAYRVFAEGFWDGAEVRVYRVRNGSFYKVCDERVAEGGYTTSGWESIVGDDDKVIDPTVSEARIKVGKDWRTGVPYYFSVRSVGTDGTESGPSNVVSVSPDSSSKGSVNNSVEDFEPTGEVNEAPVAPSNLSASIQSDGQILLKWEAPNSFEPAGYRVYFSEHAPENHKGFHLRLTTSGGSHLIKDGDLAFVCTQKKQFNPDHIRHIRYNNKSFSSGSFIKELPKDKAGMDWELVEHPGQIPPEFTDHGETCLKLTLDSDTVQFVSGNRYAGHSQDYYATFTPGIEYVVEFWVRSDATRENAVRFTVASWNLASESDPSKFPFEPVDFTATNEWQKKSVVVVPDSTGIQSSGVRTIVLKVTGPGTFWIDGFKMYPKNEGHIKPDSLALQRTKEAGLEAIRFHNHIKSGLSHSMEMLTNAPGVIGTKGLNKKNNSNTLPVLLDYVKQSNTNPWLQTEMHMSETEWLGLVEYLAAPYDPQSDTPEEKPWAYKRYLQGYQTPWVNEFEKIYFEISNETWNWLFWPWVFGAGTVDEETGVEYSRAAEYGLYNEYVLGVLRSSPYWTNELGEKFVSVLGGWSVGSGRENGYSAQAIMHSPNSDFVTQAGYNGGWDTDEPPATPDDSTFARIIAYWNQKEPEEAGAMELRRELIAQGRAHEYKYGTYEAGPGYALPGLNNTPPMTNEEKEAQEEVGKSLANGVATLDAFLGRAVLGYQTQNFFTLQFRKSYWTSHQAITRGAVPYPSFLGLQLYNTRGTGDFLSTEVLSVPTRDLPAFKKRDAREDAAMVSVYATNDGDRVNVFVLSKKIDQFIDENNDGKIDEGDHGFTPTTIHLPFTSAESVTLFKMSGDPRANNLYEENVRIEERTGIGFDPEFVLNKSRTGESRDGLPPGSIFLYVFEGTDIGKPNLSPRVSIHAPATAEVHESVTFAGEAVDPEDDPVTFTWVIDERDTMTGPEVAKTFDRPGLKRIELTARDGRGGSDFAVGQCDVLVPVDGEYWAFRDYRNDESSNLQYESGSGRFILDYTRDVALGYPVKRLQGSFTIETQLVSNDKTGWKGSVIAGLAVFSRNDSRKDFEQNRIALVFSPDSTDPMKGYAELLLGRDRTGAPANGIELPYWIRLERVGNQFTGYVSPDGTEGSWVKVSSVEADMPETVLVGIFGDNNNGQAIFESVRFDGVFVGVKNRLVAEKGTVSNVFGSALKYGIEAGSLGDGAQSASRSLNKAVILDPGEYAAEDAWGSLHPTKDTSGIGIADAGYITVHASGPHEVYLTADRPATLVVFAMDSRDTLMTAHVPVAVDSDSWYAFGEQKSNPAYMETGKRYGYTLEYELNDSKVEWSIGLCPRRGFPVPLAE